MVLIQPLLPITFPGDDGASNAAAALSTTRRELAEIRRIDGVSAIAGDRRTSSMGLQTAGTLADERKE